MHVETTKINEVLLVTILENRLDSVFAHDFQELIHKWTIDGVVSVVLDLSHVDFIDSTILGVIVQWLKVVHGQQRSTSHGTEGVHNTFALCGIGFKVHSLLQLTRMNQVFALFPDAQEAVRVMTATDGRM